MSFLRRYIFSLDHKVIGRQYYFLALFSVVVGMALSWLMRIHVVWPNLSIWGLHKLSPAGAPGGVITPEYYLSLMTLHGTIMIFFVLTTAPQAAFGNFMLPLQIGSEEMAFPRLNMLSFWATFAALMVLLATFFVTDGPPISGWTAYPPLSAIAGSGPGEALGQTLWIVAIAIFCLGSLLGSINFIATVLDLRTAGMSLWRMPLSCWSWFVTAVLSLLSFSVLLAACALLLLDRAAGASFFIPTGLVVNGRLQPHAGGSPLLWQHLFWFFGHPEVYIAILPGMGIVSHLLPCFARKPILGYRVIVYCILAIGALSFVLWGHHMFVSGMSPVSSLFFSIPTLVISVPSAIMLLNWLGTLWGGRLRLTTAMMFCLGFISVFVTGGLSGIFLAQPSLDSYLHATYFVVGHFHMIMGVAAVFGIFAGTYYWFPKMFGRMLHETLGKLHFWLTFAGVYCIFMPMHFLGLAGNVRRYSAFTDTYLLALIPVHKFITVAALITGAVQFVFLFNLFWSLRKGKPASANPWQATSLEWATSSPPPQENFSGREMIVHRGPDEYGVEEGDKDYIMQDAGCGARDNANAIMMTSAATSQTERPRAWSIPLHTYRTGVLLLLAEIVMVFAAFTSAMVVRKGASNDWIQTRLPHVLYWSSLLLLAGSAVLELVRRRVSVTEDTAETANLKRVRRAGVKGLSAAVLSGLAFLFCQWLAFQELAARGLRLASNPSSSFLYVFTVAHSLHLFGGMVGLAYIAAQIGKPDGLTGERGRSALGAATLYWHFMTGLWIYILALFTVRW